MFTFAALSLGALVTGALALSFIGRHRFGLQVDEERARFLADATPAKRPIDVEAETADLPPPVQRYLRSVLGPKATAVTTVTLKHGGSFRLKPGGPLMPMEAVEYFRADRPGYLWHARIRMGPMIWAEVRDFYQQGHGSMLGRLNSTWTIVKSETPEVAQGALIRWATEAAWFPQVFLDRKLFTWQAIDDRSARLVVQDSGLRATFTCHFGEDGRLTRMTTEDRPFEKEGQYIRGVPFSGLFRDWRQMDGVWIPAHGEATWNLPEGDFNYVQVQVERIDYDRG